MEPSVSSAHRAGLIEIGAVNPKARLGHLLILVAVLSFWGVGLYLVPDPRGHGTHQQLGLPPCLIYFLTGRSCPSCGLTTSVSALLHGNFALAWRVNPFGFAIVAFSLGLFLNSLMALVVRRSVRMRPSLVNWGVMLFLLWWALHGAIRFLVR